MVNSFDTLNNNTGRSSNNTLSTGNDSCLKSWKIFNEIIFSQMILNLMFNTLLVFLILQSKKLRNNISNQVFLNIPCTHVFATIIWMILRYHPNRKVFMITNALVLQLFFSLLLTSLHRFLAIKFPYAYQKITRKHAFVASLFTWCISTAFYVITLHIKLTRITFITMVVVMISVSSIILTFINVSIYVIAKQHIGAILKTSVGSRSSVSVRKPAYTCFLLVATFIICWFPDLIHNITIISGTHDDSLSKCNLILNITAIILHSNGFLDAIIYVLMKRDIKIEIKKLGRYCSKCRSKDWLRTDDTEHTFFVSSAF